MGTAHHPGAELRGDTLQRDPDQHRRTPGQPDHTTARTRGCRPRRTAPLQLAPTPGRVRTHPGRPRARPGPQGTASLGRAACHPKSIGEHLVTPAPQTMRTAPTNTFHMTGWTCTTWPVEGASTISPPPR